MRAAGLALLVLAAPAVASAEPSRPLGALGSGGDLLLTGAQGGSRQRAAADAIVWIGPTYGAYVGARRLSLDPFADEGQVTGGVALRAAAARPRLEIVLHGDLGYAWPAAPVAGGGVIAYLWPVTRVPVAVTGGLSGYLILDGADDTRLALSVGVGLALAR